MSESATTSMQRLAARLGRFGLIYAIGAVGVAVLALGQAVAVTQFMTPVEFGNLAVLLAFGGIFTLVSMLATLQGTLGRVFGTTGDEDAPDPADVKPGEESGDPGLSLMTGTLVMVGMGAIAVVVVWPFAPGISESLLGNEGFATEVRLAVAAGVLAAPFRLLMLFPRYGRRGRRFVLMEVGRLVVILGAMLPVLAAGGGLDGALTGVMIGEGLALLAAIAITRKDLTFSFSFAEAFRIVKKGLGMAPVLISNYVITSVDLLILTAYVGAADIGEYRLAASFGAFIAQPVSIFLMAWGPLSRSPLQKAANEESSKAEISELVLRYAWVTGLGLLLGTALYADRLVKLSPETYSGAATLIPLLGCGFVLRAMFVIIYRTALFSRVRQVFIGLNPLAAVVFIIAAISLIPAIGTVGAAAARIIAYGGAATVIAILSQRSKKPLPIRWLAMTGALAVAALSYGIGHYAGLWLEAAALLGPAVYVSVVFGIGILPHAHLTLVATSAARLRPRHPSKQIEARLRALPEADLTLLRNAFRGDSEVEASGADMTGPELELLATALNRAAPESINRPAIEPVAMPYALSYDRIAQHDRIGTQMQADGIDPVVLDMIDETIRAIKMVPQRRWPAGRAAD